MNENKLKILVIDDEAPIREILSASLKDEGFIVETGSDGRSGLLKIKEWNPDIVFLDIWMPGSYDGIEVLKVAKNEFPRIEFVMISGHGTIETAVKATKLGAWDFIEKPLSIDKISIVIQNIISFQNEKEEKLALLNKLRKSIALVGETDGIISVKQFISKVSSQKFSVYLMGENGVGKHLVAQNIHYMSSRASKPFIEVNGSNIPVDLQEMELFGVKKGALPGMDKTKKGKVELASGGTIFIEDIESFSEEAQYKILQLLQTNKYKRFGSSADQEVDVRIIFSSSATNSELKNIENIRHDLMYFLKMNMFTIPNLHQRKKDIPVLVSYFSDHFSIDSGYTKKVFSEKALDLLTEYQWPGNIRELKNFVERVYILTPSEFVDVHDIRFAGLIDEAAANIQDKEFMSSFREARAQFEKEYLIKKISENGGNISKTAELIGLERSYLHRKIKTYGLDNIKD